MTHPLPALTIMHVTKRTFGPEELNLIMQMRDAYERGANQATTESKRSEHRLINFMVVAETSLKAMSQRLRNISKYGETLPDLDADEIIAWFRRKKGN